MKGKVIKTNRQAAGFTLFFPNGLLWISSLVFVQLSVQRGVSYTRLQLYSLTTGGKAEAKQY